MSALIGFHTITDSDYTSGFREKDEVKPLKLLVKNSKFPELLSYLGEEFDICDDIISQLEKFVTTIYSC